MNEKIKKILSRKGAVIVFTLAIIIATVYPDITNTKISPLYALVPALLIIRSTIYSKI